MSALASQITSLTIVYSTLYSRHRSKKTTKLHISGLCAGNSPGTDEFPAQRASNTENVPIWWHHHYTVNKIGRLLLYAHWLATAWCLLMPWFLNRLTAITLTRWGRDKMAAISQTALSNTFSWMEMLEFRSKFHWSLFLRVQLTISQHWFR